MSVFEDCYLSFLIALYWNNVDRNTTFFHEITACVVSTSNSSSTLSVVLGRYVKVLVLGVVSVIWSTGQRKIEIWRKKKSNLEARKCLKIWVGKIRQCKHRSPSKISYKVSVSQFGKLSLKDSPWAQDTK